MNYKNYSPQENEFFAENELIQIQPLFRLDKFEFISGSFGPFKPAAAASKVAIFAICWSIWASGPATICRPWRPPPGNWVSVPSCWPKPID